MVRHARVATGIRRFGDELAVALRMLRPHAVPLAAILAVLAFFHRGTLGWLWNAWLTNDYYTHGVLVPFVVAFFVWRARHRIAAHPDASPRWQDLSLLAASFGLYAYAFPRADAFLLSLSLLLGLAGAALYVFGWARAKHVMLPLALLLLTIPPPNLLEVGLRMQMVASAGTTAFLALFGVPVVQDDFLIHAGALTFEVVPMCSGLSSMISILTLTSVIAALPPLRPWAKALLVLAAAPVAIAANVVRIALTIAIGLRWGPEASQGFLHGASSLVLFLLALGLVLALSSLLTRIRGARVA